MRKIVLSADSCHDCIFATFDENAIHDWECKLMKSDKDISECIELQLFHLDCPMDKKEDYTFENGTKFKE